MNLRIIPSMNNSNRKRRQKLKEIRKSIHDSKLTKAKKKLFKIKYASNDTLYNNPNAPAHNIGGHYILTVGINSSTYDVAVAVITSLEDSHGNPTKQEQIERGLIYPLEHVKGLSRRSGIKQDVLVENPYTGKKINYSFLQNPSRKIEIGVSEEEEVTEFLFNNEQHTYKSHRNRVRTQNYIKVN